MDEDEARPDETDFLTLKTSDFDIREPDGSWFDDIIKAMEYKSNTMWMDGDSRLSGTATSDGNGFRGSGGPKG